MKRKRLTKDGSFESSSQVAGAKTPSTSSNPPRLDQLQKIVGNEGTRNLLQGKLKVSQPDDALEQEADHIADTVMRMDGSAAEQASPSLKTSGIQRDVRDSEAEKELVTELEKSGAIVQRRLAQTAGGPRAPTVTYGSASALSPPGGQPLPPSVRNFMEPRFGRDFSDVRVHNDADSAAVASSLNAHAFTVGRHVTFAEGQYAPETSAGQRLIAHELSHVVQQDDRPGQIQRKIIVDGKPYTPTEKYYKYLDGEGLGVMKEFIKTMHNDGKAPDFTFSSFEQMGTEVRVRQAAIKGMDEANTGTCQYPDAAHPAYLDSTYWDKAGPMYFKAKSPLPKGKEASDAIEAIFAAGSGTRLECMAMTFAVQYRAMMNGMGKDKFNKMFPGGAGLEISNRNMAAELVASKKYKVIGVGSKSEILPGDWVYFKNFKDYKSKHPGGYWQGENAVYMGGGMYSGFGVSSASEKDMNKELVKAYTGNATATDKEVADLIADGGGLLLNPVARPDIGQIAP